MTEGRGLDSTYDLIDSYNQRDRARATRPGSTTSSSSTSATSPTSTSSASASRAFPGIPDLAIAKMVQGIEVDLFRPDDELKKLAKLAVELGGR